MAEKVYKYDFSVVSAVYNAADFLDDFFRSMIKQSHGFHKIQLIMVDDGSPDTSGEICDKYAAEYPNNILVIHKENGGVGQARTDGLEYAEGKYINFCDPDDTLSENAMEMAYAFLERHSEDVKIAAIPIYLFGYAEGEHHLNTKFQDGERVINVLEEYMHPQLSVSSAFFRHEAAKGFKFSTRLVTAEDAEQIAKLLVDYPYLGVLPDAAYHYRRYASSLVSSSKGKRGAYMDYINYFSLEIMNYAKARLGFVPKFIQYTVMCDLKWKLKLSEMPDILSEADKEEYLGLVHQVICGIDDDIILEQKSLSLDAKLYYLEDKHGAVPKLLDNGDLIFGSADSTYARYSEAATILDYLKISDGEFKLSLRQTYFSCMEAPSEVYLQIGDTKVQATMMSCIPGEKSLGRAISSRLAADFSFSPALLTGNETSIEIHTVTGTFDVVAKSFRNGIAFPISTILEGAYARLGKHLFFFRDGVLTCRPSTFFRNRKMEFGFIIKLWKNGGRGTKKAALARMLLPFYRLLHRKPVWIISDRLNKAGDNGEAFFRYLKKINYKKAKIYFAIGKSADYDKLRPLGGVINRKGWRYKMMHLVADKIISSHADAFVTNPFAAFRGPYLDIISKQDFIFMQHGVTKDNISGWINRYSKNIRGFITAAIPEYSSILETPTYYFTEREVWQTGFARFDRLYHDEKKYITIMPTWRQYLMDGVDAVSGVWKESPAFRASEYFVFYNALINNERLLSAAEQYGYTICYLPHPNVITKIDMFDRDGRVKFFTINDEYRKIYAESNLVLTDYSSAVFDFAYLRKPVLYAQFDKDEFFRGEHVYTKGYFDYERDGFGEVTYDLEATIDTIIEYMKNDCRLKDKYRERIDNFFAYDDKNNPCRILEKIENLGD